MPICLLETMEGHMEKSKLKSVIRRSISIACAAVVMSSSAAIAGYAKTPEYNNNVLGVFNLTYDSKKKTIEDKDGRGIIGIGFDYDVGQDIYFSSNNCWQRNFGYSTFYDDMAPLFNMHFYNERYYFYYGGKDWLIEAWKGQYGITTGGEVGVYTKAHDREIKHYDCASDSDALKISMSLYADGQKLFDRPAQKSWWLTGFVLGPMYQPHRVGMIYKITFKDKAMLQAFKKSIQKNDRIKYSYNGLTATCHWYAGVQE